MQDNEIEEEVTEMKAWQDKIRSVVPYTPGEQPNRPNMIKLNTNENPYPPAPGVRKVLDTLDEDKLRLYPDPTAGTLVGALADYYHVGKDQVFTGVGSDDVLAIAFGQKTLTVEVLAVAEAVRKDDASAMYREIAG